MDSEKMFAVYDKKCLGLKNAWQRLEHL